MKVGVGMSFPGGRHQAPKFWRSSLPADEASLLLVVLASLPHLSELTSITWGNSNGLPRDSCHSRQGNTPTTPLCFRFITRLKFRQAPKGEVQSVTYEEVRYTPKELLEYSNLCWQKFRERVWKRIVSVWDNDRRNIKFDLAEFVDMSSLSTDSAFFF